MKVHVFIATLMMVLGGMQSANVADGVYVKSAMYSTQMQNLSKRPYQQPKRTSAAADTAWQDARLGINRAANDGMARAVIICQATPRSQASVTCR